MTAYIQSRIATFSVQCVKNKVEMKKYKVIMIFAQYANLISN